jgi:hypothetical protein
MLVMFTIIIVFIGVTSAIALLTSSFPYKKQSFLLGITGAVGGGGIALLQTHGLSVITAEAMLLLCISESILFLLYKNKAV